MLITCDNGGSYDILERSFDLEWLFFLASDADVFGLANINSLNAILGCYLLVKN